MKSFKVEVDVQTTPEDADLMLPDGGFAMTLDSFFKGTAVKIGVIKITEVTEQPERQETPRETPRRDGRNHPRRPPRENAGGGQQRGR